MDYITKPTSRATLRRFSKIVRAIFDCESDDEPFPVLMLWKSCLMLLRTQALRS